MKRWMTLSYEVTRRSRQQVRHCCRRPRKHCLVPVRFYFSPVRIWNESQPHNVHCCHFSNSRYMRSASEEICKWRLVSTTRRRLAVILYALFSDMCFCRKCTTLTDFTAVISQSNQTGHFHHTAAHCIIAHIHRPCTSRRVSRDGRTPVSTTLAS
jgi:hypothetical protein